MTAVNLAWNIGPMALARGRDPLPYLNAHVALVGLRALVGMTMSRGLLDLSLFRLGPGSPDFGLTNWLLNLPHIVLATLALWIGVRKPGERALRVGATV